MTKFDGCQLPGVPHMSEGLLDVESQPFVRRFKRSLAVPWNYYVKRWLKKAYHLYKDRQMQNNNTPVTASTPLKKGDRVRVRTWAEIEVTLDLFKESKGCAFLPEMKQFCGTTQTAFKVIERFLDERDYKVKKVRGTVLLEGVICEGTPVFGRCDRSCFLFWREEWLEKIDG